MQFGLRVTSRTSLQIPPQPVLPDSEEIPRDADQPYLAQSIISPKHGLEVPLQTEAPPPKACSSPGPAGKSCWNLDIRVAMLVLALAGVVIVLLLYRLLQMRHRLRLARARHALEYHSFFHTATYTLKHPEPCLELPAKNVALPEAPRSVHTQLKTEETPTAPPPPPPPSLPTPPPVLPPPPPLHPPLSSVVSLPLPLHLPVIQTTPSSPHLSWGACSDVDVYSRIGAFRPSRLSGASNQSQVILFEHSSL
ncbi:uncharacterized protein LOC142890313 [Nelusetta ayraudi]|uniref:uncharacterized protein LOC142890313 n=1 Tax=Nelusetta ayraudi TaxID=303726 RepID=UPI003F72ACE2